MNTDKISTITSKPGLVIALILAYEDYLRQMEWVEAVDPNGRPSEEETPDEDDEDLSPSPEEDVVPDTEDPNEAADDITE